MQIEADSSVFLATHSQKATARHKYIFFLVLFNIDCKWDKYVCRNANFGSIDAAKIFIFQLN